MPGVEQGKIVAGDAVKLDSLTLKKHPGGKLLMLCFYSFDSEECKFEQNTIICECKA